MILGVTPARGQSKGIPGKNIKLIAGKPLLAWTIEAAKKSKLIDRYVVSTEDKAIAEVAREFKADVLMRPKALASDRASTLSVLQHALKNIPCDTIILLQATSPVRSAGLIDECINEFLSKRYDSLATGFICKFTEYAKTSMRRQDIKGFFYDDGNVYVLKADLLRKGDRFGGRIGRKIISRWENTDIDDAFDFWLAENILLKRDIA